MENTVFEGAEAAVAGMLEELRKSNPHILELHVIPMGSVRKQREYRITNFEGSIFDILLLQNK